MDDNISQRPLFSEEPGTLGFDLSSGNVWIYPENYPIREYQFNIVKTALYNNTLVCLPTGLGKTFIAAVVMYNFWRWYPRGKVVFLAPTKPLVAQQINACHEIMGIPSEETIELTGTTNQKQREIAWAHKRVIFATPQTFHKDLEKNIFPMNLVKCIVIDEAHKSLGKHSYCESIRLLSEENKFFRIVALSATPGDKISKVHEVISSLRISNLELRDDMSPDIAPYINDRKVDIILIRLSNDLAKFKERYITVMDPHVRVLVRLGVLRGETGNISKGKIFYLTKEFQSKPNKPGNYGQIMKTLNILLTMYHAYELMVRHGLRAFLHFYENHSDKFWMEHELSLHDLLEDIKGFLGPFPVIEPLPDGSVPDVPNDLIFGHNKFYKLKELLERHFKSFRDKNQETKAIIFVEYRDIVNEVYVLLLQSRPLIRPQMFVGQAGQKQRQQIKALENFRSNQVNVLISTSVGEEGLDVGEVDLIICFDISQSSPIRLVQRMGRTGRQRDGHIIALVTDGKEHQALKATMSKKESLNNKVLQSSDIVSSLYNESPRMVPNQFNPECRKMHIQVQPKTPQVKGARKKKLIDKKKKTNIETKTVEREVGSKRAGQSSMDRFFRQRRPDEESFESSPIFVHQTQQTVKSENVQLLLSDKENVEFLTLCTMRKSRIDFHILDTEIDTTYFPSFPDEEPEKFLNFTLPDLSILDCIASLQELKIPSQKIASRSISTSPVQEEVYEPNCFETDNECYTSNFETSEALVARSFADLIYDSSSSDGGEVCEKFEKKSTKFENSAMFDDLLNETTDESEIEEFGLSQNQDPAKEVTSNLNNMAIDDRIVLDKQNMVIEVKTAIEGSSNNFSRLLEDTSVESKVVQEDSKSVILEKSWSNLSEQNQNNISREDNFTFIRSNTSGITITQALEEIARINANNSLNNHCLIQKEGSNEIQIIQDDDTNQIQISEEEDSDDIQIIDEIPKNSILEQKQLPSSISQLKKTGLRKNHLQFQITDSDDDLFDIDTPEEVQIVNDRNILKSSELQVQTSSKSIKDEIVPNNHYKIMRLDSNKSVPPAEKENSNLELNMLISDVDWDIDFRVGTSPVDSQKYFKVDESLKASAEKTLESCETDWKPCGEKSNVDTKNSQPVKKLSLFQSNNKSVTSHGTSDKNTSIDSGNKTSSRDIDEKKRNDDFEVFKKPAVRAPGIFSLKRTIANVQSTFHGKLNGQSIYFNQERASSSGIRSKMEEERKDTSFNLSLEQSPEIKRKRRKVIKRKCEFIDNEADVSSDGGNTSEGTSGEDEDLDGFVSYTQDVSDHVDMQAHYLKSVKSPSRKAGAFLIKEGSRIPENVYSQPMSQLNDTYLHDSFCVREDEIEYDEETDDDLEITCLQEFDLLERERKRKRGVSPSFHIKRKKRKKGRILTVRDDSSSEDETEQIRRQIQEESFLLKNNQS
ncbi:Fanconi anemia group M protein [Belonocnema kinseyi]|uniref:Fanconi anemia group M protein n=1 Tax=Belonocnema kinseyi TaxID=2817044 RepID=UPI00143DAAC9|nr:Fanconi anemia group M protein [Belonocnema kinseyi]XP_033207129.1 Fanconi anemia group M protein [Belonocnema kinseyi]